MLTIVPYTYPGMTYIDSLGQLAPFIALPLKGNLIGRLACL